MRHPYLRKYDKHCSNVFSEIKRKLEAIKSNGGKSLGKPLTNSEKLQDG